MNGGGCGGEVIGLKTRSVHPVFAVISRIYDRGRQLSAKHAVIREAFKNVLAEFGR